MATAVTGKLGLKLGQTCGPPTEGALRIARTFDEVVLRSEPANIAFPLY
jgi:hypothetical protein